MLVPSTDGGYYFAGSSATINGAITTATGSTIRVQPTPRSRWPTALPTTGTIELDRGTPFGAPGSSYGSTLNVTAGTLTNAGTLLSTGAGTATNHLNLNGGYGTPGALLLANGATGLLQVDASLRVNHYYGVADLSSGTLSVAAGQTLSFYNNGSPYGASVKLGSGTNFGASPGVVDIVNGTLTLASDLTLPSSGGQLTLSGSITVEGPGTLINQGTLTLSGDTINAPLNNQGLVLVPSTDGGYYFAGSSATINGAITTATGSTMRVQPGSTLNIANGFTNNGTIELDRGTPSGAPGSSYGSTLNVTAGTLTNAGTLLSTGTGTASNPLNLNGGYGTPGTLLLSNASTGTLQVDASLQVNHYYGVVDLSSGTLNVATGQTLSFYNSGSSYGASVKLGSGTNFGSSAGVVDITGGALTLASDLTLPATGWRLDLSGSITVEGPGALINQATLTLSGDTINAPLNNQGLVLVPSTDHGDYFSSSSATLNGALTTAAGSTIRVQPGSTLTVANGFTSNGTIELDRAMASGSANSYGSTLNVTAGTLTNAGTLLSTGAGTAGTATNYLYLYGGYGTPGTVVLANAGTGVLQVDASLQVNHYYGAVDLSAGTVNIAAGQTLGFYGYGLYSSYYDSKVVLGAVTGFGTGAVLDLQGSDVLVLTRDLTLPATSPTSGWQLNLSGSITVNGATGTEKLTNQGTLDLAGDTINAALVNQGTVSLQGSTLNGAFNNQGTLVAASTISGDGAGGSYYIGAYSTINGALTTGTGSTIRVQPNSTLTVANGFTNNGLIELDRASTTYYGNNYELGATLTVSSGTLANAGTILSTGAGTATNYLYLYGGSGTPGTVVLANAGTGVLQVDASLQVNHYYGAVDLSAGTVNIAAGQTLGFYGFGQSQYYSDSKVVLGAVTGFGTGAVLDLQGSDVLVLTRDLTLPATSPTSGWQLNLSGSITVNGATGTEKLINQGTLTLSGDTINAPLDNQGLVLVPSTDYGYSFSGSSATLNGALTTAAGSTIRVQPGSALTVANGFTNNGTIELDRAVASGAANSYGSTLNVTAGTLTNAGTLLSTGAGTAANTLRLYDGYGVPGTVVLVNAATGLLEVDASLQVNHYYGAVDLSAGTVNIAAGQTLGFYGYGLYSSYYDSKVVLGAVTGFGTGAVLDLQGSDVLVLTHDLTLPATSPTSGWQLNLSGSITVNGATGTEKLTNQGTLTLVNDTINVPVINTGMLTLTYSTLNGALDNQGLVLVPSTDYGYYFSGSNATLNGAITTATGSTMRVQPGSTLKMANGFTNNGHD